MNKKLKLSIFIFILPFTFTIFLLHLFPDTLAYFKGNISANDNFGEIRYLVNLTHKLNKTNDFSKPNYSIPIQYRSKLNIGSLDQLLLMQLIIINSIHFMSNMPTHLPNLI